MQQLLVIVLVALSLLQAGRGMSENGAQEPEENQSTAGGSHQPAVLNVDHYLLQLNSKLDTLVASLETLQSKLEALDTSVTEHKADTAAELAQLKTSLTSTQSSQITHTQQMYSQLNLLSSRITGYQHLLEASGSKLDDLTATTTQLSSDHQQLQTSISGIQCMDTQQLTTKLNMLTASQTAHMQETSSELDQLQTSLTASHSSLDTKLESINHTIYSKLDNCPAEGTELSSDQTYTCGGTGGWRRAVYLDMTDPSTTCPSGWQLTGYSKRTCGRVSTGYWTCDSVTFPVRGGEYSKVCGRIKAYQRGGLNGFEAYIGGRYTTIDGPYVSGISVTHGAPRQHIWTFAAGISEGNPTSTLSCPCDASRSISVPPFVGNDYFCESGVNEPFDAGRHHIFFPNDILWDGEDCLSSSTCCSLHSPPYFVKQLPASTSDNIEARICMVSSSYYDNLGVELVEFYVK